VQTIDANYKVNNKHNEVVDRKFKMDLLTLRIYFRTLRADQFDVIPPAGTSGIMHGTILQYYSTTVGYTW